MFGGEKKDYVFFQVTFLPTGGGQDGEREFSFVCV